MHFIKKNTFFQAANKNRPLHSDRALNLLEDLELSCVRNRLIMGAEGSS